MLDAQNTVLLRSGCRRNNSRC